jgi:DNA-binding response OmpR family regulator
VLFADDDPLLHRLMDVNFRLAGIEMDGAHRGDDALRRLREAPPDALILDASMPGMDGHEVYRRLRDEPALADLPVIFLTGRSPEEFSDYVDARVRVVTKPFDPTQLVELVRTTIEARA